MLDLQKITASMYKLCDIHTTSYKVLHCAFFSSKICICSTVVAYYDSKMGYIGIQLFVKKNILKMTQCDTQLFITALKGVLKY